MKLRLWKTRRRKTDRTPGQKDSRAAETARPAQKKPQSALPIAAALFLAAMTCAVISAAGRTALIAANGGAQIAAPGEKVAYLTFDDGPSCNTARILDVLREKGVKATFFVTAEQPDHTDWIKTIAEEGHAVGAHCYSHDTGRLYASLEAFSADLSKICALIEEQCGAPPALYRFPGGSRTTLAPAWLREKLVEEVEGRGLTYFDWNAVSGDDTRTVYPAETLVENVLRDANGADVIVPLFHDFPVAKTTAEAAGLLIDRLRGAGYRFDVLTPEVEMRFP